MGGGTRLAHQAEFVIWALVAAPLVPTDIGVWIRGAAVTAVASILMRVADASAETQLHHGDDENDGGPLDHPEALDSSDRFLRHGFRLRVCRRSIFLDSSVR